MKTDFSVPLSPDSLAAWSGGRLIGASDAPVCAACIDSREAGAGVLFCAIRGERVDGHDYMASAYAAGSRCFLCERPPAEPEAQAAFPDACFICVPDTVAALPALAAGFRAAHLPALRVIAVTGSVGKTTTKTLCAAVLRAAFPTFCREGNFNSVIGMPLCVPGIGTDVRAAVLEMGMSARGEISALSRAACPDIAVITNIGSSHLESLGTRENIARAKLEVLDGMRPGGQLLLDGDEPLLRAGAAHIRQDITLRPVSLTDKAADFFVSGIRAAADGTVFDLRLPDGSVWRDLRIPAPGRHLLLDAAYAAGRRLLVYGAAGAALLSVLVVLLSGVYVEIYQVEDGVKRLTRQILTAYALVAPCKVLNMILGGGILRSGGRTAYVMAIDLVGTWGFGVPAGLVTAFVFALPVPYVYFALSLEECLRFGISLAVFRRRRWMRRLSAHAD